MNNELNKSENSNESPPLFGSWNKLYGIVILSLAVMVFLFYIFTRAFE